MLNSNIYKMDKHNKSMVKNKRGLMFLLAFAFIFISLSYVNATTLESLGTTKVNNPYEFCQVCSDSTYILLSSIKTPTINIVLNENMTSTGSGQFCYNYTPTEIGRYDFKGISDGCEKTYATYVEVTSTGDNYNQTQTGMILAQGILIALFVGLGFSFSKEKWKLRGFFFTLALFIGVIMINSIRVLSGSSQVLDTMTNTALIVGIVAVSFMAIYLLIYYTIELFKTLKNKKEMKWEVSNRFN